MGTKDPRVDAYIAKKAEYAQPILKHLRALVHKGCPEVVETIKWGMPAFEYKGPFCGMAAFKKHCVFGFWKSAILFGEKSTTPDKSAPKTNGQSKAAEKLNWGAHGRDPIKACITSIDDLPSDAVIIKLLKQAMKLNDEGIKVPMKRTKRKPLPMPKEFAAALKKTKTAQTKFDAFSPSCKREYIEWIVEAKTDETRQRRMETAVEWIADGKQRHWKYQKK